MASSEKKFPRNLATLVHFFHKNPLYELHWMLSCHQVMRICPKKNADGLALPIMLGALPSSP
jgi:hypothetical protein